MLDFRDKVVVITGGATGIGFALAKSVGAEGARVVIAEPREHRLKEAVKALSQLSIQADYHVCDVSDRDQVNALCEFAWSLGPRVVALINNAGIGIGGGSVMGRDIREVRRLFDVNFFGVWHGCALFGKRMIEQAEPAGIFNVGSENSLFVGVPNIAAYVASKHAILGLTDALRDELPDHIQVGLICPGFVKSEITDPSVAKLAMDTDKFAAIAMKQIKEKRFYIVSHAHNIKHIDARYQEIKDAYCESAPRYEGDDEYDIRTLMRQLQKNGQD